ncbi:MAG: MATE family efflux transporter [Thermotogae bacterium]|nr:MATE family efflux transporter [Thermotogota bacterium]MCP5465702.1 MATE family efflux transporter [Thermotogota bacterium]
MEKNLLESKNIGKTFFIFALPAVLGMILSSFMTIVDGIFIGNFVGGEALAGVNFSIPYLYVLLGIGIMISVGGLVPAGISLGSGNKKEADRIFTFTVLSGFFMVSVFTVISFVFRNNIYNFLAGKNSFYLSQYLGIMMFFYIFMIMNICFSVFMRGSGKPVLSLLFGIFSNILNVFLDYYFIVKLGLGIKGAAYASGVSIIFANIIYIVYFLSEKSVFRFIRVKYDGELLKKIIFNGSSEFVGQISVSLTTFAFNMVILKRIGVIGVSAFAVIGYIGYIQTMIITGIVQGMSPLVSYNYGKRNFDYLSVIFKIGSFSAVGISFLIVLFSEIFSGKIAGVFSGNNDEMLRITSGALIIYAFSFIPGSFNIVSSAFLTSLGKARESAVISSLRGLVFIFIFLFLLPYFLGDNGIWSVAVFSEFLTLIFSFIYIKRESNLFYKVPEKK